MLQCGGQQPHQIFRNSSVYIPAWPSVPMNNSTPLYHFTSTDKLFRSKRH
jgi:hypothetical protein